VIDELVHVSAGLREDGGGAAAFARGLGRALRRYASRRGLGFRGLHLARSDGHAAHDGYAGSGGSRARLAAAVAGLELGGARRRALVFDHPGPARVQGWLPAPARSTYAVALLGVDAWRPLAGDRRRALAGATRLFAISGHTRERAAPFLPAGARVEVVHPGLEEPAPGGAPRRPLLDELGQGFALAVGRMSARERYKGHDELLEAWPALAADLPDARLVVAGDGDDRPRLEARARELGIAPAVRFTGWVSAATVAALYRRAAVFVLPSRDEGFGLVYLEAMAAARPCLALAGGAPAEIVADGVTGRLVAAGDRAALRAALAEVLSDPALARRWGAAARARFEAEFTFAAFERRLEPVLDALVAAGGGS